MNEVGKCIKITFPFLMFIHFTDNHFFKLLPSFKQNWLI